MRLAPQLAAALLALAPSAFAQEAPVPAAPATPAAPASEKPPENPPAPEDSAAKAPPAPQPGDEKADKEELVELEEKPSGRRRTSEIEAIQEPPDEEKAPRPRKKGQKPREREQHAPAKPHQFGVFAGVRTLFVLGSGYEPFAERSVFWSASLGGNVIVSRQGPLTLALGGTLDLGRSDSSVREADTRLSAQRLTLGPELRHDLTRRFAATGHVGIGAGRLAASYDDKVIGAERVDKSYFFTADAGVGLSFRLGPLRARGPGFFLSFEGGYLYSPATGLELTTSAAPARSAPLRFPDLSLSGPYTRLNVALTF